MCMRAGPVWASVRLQMREPGGTVTSRLPKKLLGHIRSYQRLHPCRVISLGSSQLENLPSALNGSICMEPEIARSLVQ
jgi:hypothetical protein